MSILFAFGWASIMLLIGVFLRAKIPFLRNMLIPASVIAGILGLLFMNASAGLGISVGADSDLYTSIVDNLFTISFISIGLTAVPKTEGSAGKNILKGSLGMGMVWNFIYALTPLLAMGVTALAGRAVGMDKTYGLLIQFAFCQGPGQSASFGAMFEEYGWENASAVAVTFSVIGFLAAFLVGVPLARLGMKKGLAKHSAPLDGSTRKGYFDRSEQPESGIRDTTSSMNIETLAFHFAIIGLCYILACGISRLFSLIPGFFGTTLSGMMYLNGMYAAYIVKFVMKRLKIDHLLNNALQKKITGWATDYLIVSAFMSVSLNLIGSWIVPMLIVCAVTTAATLLVCCYFGRRFGGSNDFERTLGLYGMSTGTVPNGVALVRIADPDFETTTSVELGTCNLVMLCCTPVYLFILAYVSGTIPLPAMVLGILAFGAGYLAVLKLAHVWGRPTYSWRAEKEEPDREKSDRPGQEEP